MKKLIALFMLFLPLLAIAAVPMWQIVPSASSLKFTATQNNAPVSGEFKQFGGEIYFDPNQLKASHIKITVKIASVSDAYNQLSETLNSADWFNSSVFPDATFQSTEITKTGDKTYQAKGMLTIRNKTLPVTLNFSQQEYSDKKAVMEGSTTIQRTAFGVGQGDWADTKTVKDDVKVDFLVTAIH